MGCDHICLTTKNGAVCICQDGYELESSGKQCTGRHGNIYLIEPIAKKELSIDKFT
jgi:hypothetical protein